MNYNITKYTKILLISLYLILGLIKFEVPISGILFVFISATVCFIFSPILLIKAILNKSLKIVEKIFLISSYICINTLLLIGVAWEVYREVNLIYFLIPLFFLFISEFSYRKHLNKDIKKDFIKAIYLQRLIIIPLTIIIFIFSYF